jgi:NADH:ubiquinone oxidoreductase subunit E
MPLTDEGRLREKLTALTEQYGQHRSALIPILAEVKAAGHEIDSDSMQIIADVLDIHPVEVYSVATFYAFLHPERQGQFVVRLCKTLSCELQGKAAIADALQAELGIGFDETTDDGVFTLEWAACMGMCDQGPALLVNDVVHTRLTAEKVREIIAGCRACASCVTEVTA